MTAAEGCIYEDSQENNCIKPTLKRSDGYQVWGCFAYFGAAHLY